MKIGDIFEEDVNGIIIGEITRPYQFWKTETIGCIEKKVCVDRMHFSDDEEAIEWFKTEYPDEFKAGVEMRIYDI